MGIRTTLPVHHWAAEDVFPQKRSERTILDDCLTADEAPARKGKGYAARVHVGVVGAAAERAGHEAAAEEGHGAGAALLGC